MSLSCLRTGEWLAIAPRMSPKIRSVLICFPRPGFVLFPQPYYSPYPLPLQAPNKIVFLQFLYSCLQFSIVRSEKVFPHFVTGTCLENTQIKYTSLWHPYSSLLSSALIPLVIIFSNVTVRTTNEFFTGMSPSIQHISLLRVDPQYC